MLISAALRTPFSEWGRSRPLHRNVNRTAFRSSLNQMRLSLALFAFSNAVYGSDSTISGSTPTRRKVGRRRSGSRHTNALPAVYRSVIGLRSLTAPDLLDGCQRIRQTGARCGQNAALLDDDPLGARCAGGLHQPAHSRVRFVPSSRVNGGCGRDRGRAAAFLKRRRRNSDAGRVGARGAELLAAVRRHVAFFPAAKRLAIP